MKSSSEITKKVVAATLLTGLFNLSQVEACEGRRVNPVYELRNVVESVGPEKPENLPADFATRDERVAISEPLSPVGRMSLKGLPERKGSSALIPGPGGKACYVLTSLHILPDGEGVSAVTNKSLPNLLGKSFDQLKSENWDRVTIQIGDKFEKVVDGEIVGGGQATLLPKPAEAGKDYVPKYDIAPSQDWVLVRLNQPVDNRFAEPIKLNRDTALDTLRGVETSGIPTDKNRGNEKNLSRYGSICQKTKQADGKVITECGCETTAEKNRGEFVVRYSCTAMPGMSGGVISYVDQSGEKVLETLVTKFNVRKTKIVNGKLVPTLPTASKAAGPSIAHIAPQIDELMRQYPCR